MRATHLAPSISAAPAMTILRSAIFFIWFILVSVAIHLAALPVLVMPRRAICMVSKTWSELMLWGLRVFADLDYEVRGSVPAGGVLVASKHMSMWDTVALYLLLNDGVFVAKRELFNIPFYGWYLKKAGTIMIDRRGHATALRKMIAAAKNAIAKNRDIFIFPEGTRRMPDAEPAYKPGVAGLYGQLGMACVPVALNSGLYWGGFVKRKGKIVLEFLPAIPPGLSRRDFMATLEERIETATRKLVAEGRAALAH